MDDSLLGSMFRALLYTLMVIFIIATMAFVYNSLTLNSYMTQVHDVITRSGGLTKKAYHDCNDISAAHYHGMFHVSKLNAGPQEDTLRKDAGWSPSDENLMSVVGDSGNPAKVDDNKGFAPDAKEQYESSKDHAFGDESEYYVYVDIPYMNNMVYHSGFRDGSAPIGVPIQSSIRSNSVVSRRDH